MKIFPSVVILNWNTSNDTIECLKSLEKQTFKKFEIILIDQNSELEEKKRLKIFLKKEHKLQIKLIENKTNVGFCEGNNIGIRKSRGNILVFLNSDTIVDRNWLKNLLKPFSKEEYGVTASKIIFYDKKQNNLVQYIGGRLTFYGMPISEGTGTKDRVNYNRQKETFWAMGASFAVKKKIFNELKELFPKIYFIYFEEVDLCWRIKNLGYKVMYCPNSVVYHKGSVSIKKSGKTGFDQQRLSFRNKYLTFYRNLPTESFVAILPLIVVYDIFRCIKHLLHANFWFTVSYVLGVKDFINTKFKVKIPIKGSLEQLSW